MTRALRTGGASLALLLLSVTVASAQDARPTPAAPAPAPAPAGRDALQQAYQKEYTFLVNEEASLTQRLAEVEGDHARRVGAATTELAALEERLRALQLELEAERARAAKLDEQAATLDDGATALEAVLAQAEAVLPHDATPAAGDDPAQRLAAVDGAFGQVAGLLRARSSVRTEKGTFFLADGKQAEGDLVWVGAIGILGASPQAAGTLAPAGGGALQLWTGNDPVRCAALARSAAQGDALPVLPLYLYESLDKPADRPIEASFREYLRRGGDVAHVIVGLGVVAMVLVLLRAVILARTTKDPAALLDAVAPLVAAGRLDEALARCKATRGAAARVVEAMLPHLGAGSEKLESAAQERMVQEALRFERFETAILVSAAVAPLLGLLGTVTGMIATFDIITIYGTGDPKLLAGGISEALITTELGLEVAIPTLLLGNLLSSWTEGVRASMERAALRVSLLVKRPGEEGAA